MALEPRAMARETAFPSRIKNSESPRGSRARRESSSYGHRGVVDLPERAGRERPLRAARRGGSGIQSFLHAIDGREIRRTDHRPRPERRGACSASAAGPGEQLVDVPGASRSAVLPHLYFRTSESVLGRGAVRGARRRANRRACKKRQRSDGHFAVHGFKI